MEKKLTSKAQKILPDQDAEINQLVSIKQWGLVRPRPNEPHALFRLRGLVYNHPRYPDEQLILTDKLTKISPIKKENDGTEYRTVQTCGEQKNTLIYRIERDAVHPEMERVYRGAFDRLPELVSFAPETKTR